MILDEAQTIAWQSLAALKNTLQAKRKFWQKAPQIKGLYLWGTVGRGKTMLMDRFFSDLPHDFKKRRQHFHAFMQEVHQKRATSTSANVIAEIANSIAKTTKIFCLDEMQVSDIADAMILGRLFDALFAKGVILVTTANQPPEGQYKDGLNRHLFLPHVARLNAKLQIIHLSDGRDYRIGRLSSGNTYLTPLGAEATASFNRLWAELTDSEEGVAQDIPLLGRKLHVPRAAHSCARFTCADLTEQPLAAPDYLCLAQNFTTIFIENIRIFKANQRNEVKRFILLIDTLYDQGAKLIASAESPPDQLCTSGPHKTEFLRTASRLQEMQSQSWWQQTSK